MNPVLSHVQAQQVVNARKANRSSVAVSLDLGRTHVDLLLNASGVELPKGLHITWPDLDTIVRNQNNCFTVADDSTIYKIQEFSPEFNRLYSLMPTGENLRNGDCRETAPTMLISGIPMHRIKGTDPQRDTKAKIRAAGPFTGPVLDTATGLGYTAIAAAQSAPHVTTIELDPVVLEICRSNPWSQALFEGSQITQLIGDSFDLIAEMADNTFAQIIHDPPMFSLAGHLYSADFYAELYRVLQPRGKLFHYIGNPESKSGRSVTVGASARLTEVGFARIQRRRDAFGIVAYKR